MPSTPAKNLLYRLALPFAAPSVAGHMEHISDGHPLSSFGDYERILVRHHVMGASLLLFDGNRTACVYTSISKPQHVANENTLFRVASITKMATAIVTLMCIDDGLFSLDTPVLSLLPQVNHGYILEGITVCHLLCHTSGLQDLPAMDKALREHASFDDVLATEGIRIGKPGAQMEYCNLGFGLLGCLLENMTGKCISELFRTKLFDKLGMRATLDASLLHETDIMPISRVLPYKAGHDVTITRLGRIPLNAPDPLRHFGHTAGAMYTDAPSLVKLLQLILGKGNYHGVQYVSEHLMNEMIRTQSSTPTRTYGLGLVLLNRPEISSNRLLGHQGFAYGCVDGAFIEEGSGKTVVFLNGGASEARTGKLGLVNRDVLTWAFRKEFATWM